MLGVAVYVVCLHFAEIDLGKLWAGLPRLLKWAARSWPPDFSELSLLLRRAAESLAMATVGISFGAVIAVPFCILGSRNVTPSLWLYHPARWVLNTLRSIDAFVFALIFVAAVGLRRFAGVLGIALHSAGSITKLWSEAIEAAEPDALEAASMSGASRIKIILYALLPDVMPVLASILLYMWEFYVRASTVRHRPGIDEQHRSADFRPRLRHSALILAMVTAIDRLIAFLRRRLI